MSYNEQSDNGFDGETYSLCPISPTTKAEYREIAEICHEWADVLDDPEPFDEWGRQLAREMDLREAAARGGERR